MPDFGPFSVGADQVAALGAANFGPFVNRLLQVEIARHGMSGSLLETTYLQNLADGGVDAGLRGASATDWIPAGDSAWQFKAGDLPPAKCKEELRGASAALDTLRAGGTYRLVLGGSITTLQIKNRRDALIAEATDLGITLAPGAIEVYAADALARWAEEHPSLAVDPILRGIGRTGLTFEGWSQSNRHLSAWTPSDERTGLLEEIRGVISGVDSLDAHVQGVSGLGKTRLVMEAVRGQPYESLVIYFPAADQVPGSLINQLLVQGRTAVVIIDECSGRQHEQYAGVLPVGSSLRLITIGEPDAHTIPSPVVRLIRFDDEAMKELIRLNVPNLWPEAVRVVVGMSAGNIKYALTAAAAIMRDPNASAATLITAESVRSFITSALPDGTGFLACSVLALFTRVGYEGEVAGELTTIGEALGFSEAELRAAARALTEQGLLSTQGRFRSVGPHPLAVYLASRAWEEYGDRIVRDLLPTLTEDMADALFTRAADIGDFGPTRTAVGRILATDGPFASLDAIAEANNSKLLVQFAILAPVEVTERISSLIEAATDEDLLSRQSIRRDLVWALEKLVWHSRTFEQAANALLRLAVFENESWSNNASGTWVDLFGAVLPGTAAPPDLRSAYLARVASSSDSRVRSLSVKAADHAIDLHGTIMVSGEVQGGVIVEPRGIPATRGDAWNYQKAALDVLRLLVDDSEPSVSEAALKALASSIHPLLETATVREHLTAALASLSPLQLRPVRKEIEGLGTLFDRVEDADGRATSLAALRASLPAETGIERLWVLTHSRRWDWGEGELQRQIIETASALPDGTATRALTDLLSGEEVPAAFEIGRALASLGDVGAPVPNSLVDLVEGPNFPALVGYLWGLIERGQASAFDDFVDQGVGAGLSSEIRLRLTVRGPRTDTALSRVDVLLADVSVSEGARNLFGWSRDIDDQRFAGYLGSWLPRLASQEDYNATIDVLALWLHDRAEPVEALEPLVNALVRGRREFPDVGQQEWDWAHLAARQLRTDPEAVVEMVAEFVDADVVRGYSASEEEGLLREGIRLAGPPAWENIMDRIAAGSWRLGMTARGWLATATDLETAETWVGADLERARVLASVASIGGAEVDAVARFLLDNFGTDRQVASSLIGEFVSGGWTGNESDRIARQIAQVQGWIDRPEESDAVKRWARHLLAGLEADRAKTLQREAERDW